MGIPAKIVVSLISAYKKFISPLLGDNCRFAPTCSEYAGEAFSRFGFFKALRLTIWRLLRCAPWCDGGHDPVPNDEIKL